MIQPRPSCRFEVTPSCSFNQDNSTTDITDENHDDGGISIEGDTRKHGVNKRYCN